MPIEYIDRFIGRFRRSRDVVETFTEGCCYWFAYALCGRFSDAVMMYDPVACHFMALIGGRLYDITGDVTEAYPKAVMWDEYGDTADRARVIKNCIMF